MCVVFAVLGVLLLGSAATAAAASPDPGGDESAALSGAPAGKLYGFAGIRQTGEPSPATAASLIAGIGGNASRTALHWQALEPRRDFFDEGRFARYESLYTALRAERIEPTLVLQFAPAWARDPGAAQECGSADACHYPPARSMLGEWREFVTEIATRFPDAAIEIWNEPNYDSQWQPGVDPARYAELLAAAEAAAAAVDPGIPIYMGGLGTAPKAGLAASDFLNKAYGASPSLEGHTDAINFHVYPGAELGAGSSFADVFANLRWVRALHGDQATPLLVSEIGATTSGGAAVGEQQQAELIMRATRRILTMRDTLGVLVYTLADRTELGATDPERGYGTLGGGGLLDLLVAKPAYCELAGSSGLSLSLLAGLPLLGCLFSEPAVEPDPASDPEPDPMPAPEQPDSARAGLDAAVTAAPRRLRAGGRPARFEVAVSAPGAKMTVSGIELCVLARSRLVRVRGRDCRTPEAIAPGGASSATFRIGLKRRAAGRGARIRFVASSSAGGAGDVARLRLRSR